MVLMPIHAEHVETILDGSKRFEFRRQLPQSIELPYWLVFYETKPTQAITAAAFVDDHIEAAVDTVIDLTVDDVPQGRDRLEQYLDGAAQPGAASIADAHPIDPAIHWEFVGPALGQDAPPQGFQYLDRDEHGALLEEIDDRLTLPTPA